MKFFRPQLEALEHRCTPCGICVGDSCALQTSLGHSPVLLTATATTLTLTVPNGRVVALPPHPITPPQPIRQEVIIFLESAGQAPPQPIIPGPAGLFVAANFIDPSAFITGGGTGGGNGP